MSISEEIIGIFAGLATTGCLIPQAFKVYKTRRTNDLSAGMFFLFSCGIGLWIIYGIQHHAISIIVANSITIILTTYILIMKVKYG